VCHLILSYLGMRACTLAPLIAAISLVIDGDFVLLNNGGNSHFKTEELARYDFRVSAKEFLGKWSHKATVVVNNQKSANISHSLLELATETSVFDNYLGVYDQTNAVIFVVEDIEQEKAILKDPKVLNHPKVFVLRVNEKDCIFSRPNPYNKSIAKLPLNHLTLNHLQPLPMKSYHLKLGTVPFGSGQY